MLTSQQPRSFFVHVLKLALFLFLAHGASFQMKNP
jgi:hypothetical protein